MPIDKTRQKQTQTLIAEAKSLLTTIQYTPEPIKTSSLLLMILNGIPLFNNLLKRLNSTTAGISKIVKKNGDAPISLVNATKVTPFIGLALNVMDFIQIPLIYFAAFALKEPSPISLSNNIQWLYSSILLALCLISLLIPVTAPLIAIVTASLGVLSSVFMFTKLYHEYAEDKKAFKIVLEKINTSPAGKLQRCILELENAYNNPNRDITLIDKLIIKLEDLKQRCNQEIKEIKTLYEEASLLEEKLNVEMDIIDQCIGIALSSLALAGTVVLLFFPPAGLIILLSAACAGTVYVASRMIASHLSTVQTQPVVSKDQNSTATLQQPDQLVQSSTKTLLNKFKLEKHNTPLKNKLQKNDSVPVTEKKAPPDAKQSSANNEHKQDFKP